MYPNFTELFMKLLPGKNSDKILQVLQCRPIFYAVRLYVMTKMDGTCQKLTTSTMCHDEPKFYVNLVNFSVEYTSTRHTI